jgi:hypothetical protein
MGTASSSKEGRTGVRGRWKRSSLTESILRSVSERRSPATGGDLIDPDGKRWTVRQRRLHLRVVRRMLRDDQRRVLVGASGGFQLRWALADSRPALWELIRRRYVGPGGKPVQAGSEYLGCEFEAPDGSRILYLEESC